LLAFLAGGAVRIGPSDLTALLLHDHPLSLLETDYIRGRSMKTEVTIREDGSVTLATWGRGESALRWLDQLQGKTRIAPVPASG
jgi:hypothetical protein